eukprot:GILI01003122.1.p1 GENE.GILI01003122.1~~GILI01003122.1.p1  ORF type:complete len:325 (+),score=117.91 GILI01003122.1:112-1086(+)
MSLVFNRESIKTFYTLDKVLGQGTFAVVKRGIRKDTGEQVAVKIIDRTQLDPEDEAALQTEVEILHKVEHPNVVKLKEIFDERTKLYMVMELMTGGELFDRIVQKEHYSEKEAADTIRPIVDAIRYCHKHGIVHRDLKPENLLYETEADDATIKISDFGLARLVSSSSEIMTTACGTPGYVAPEILMGEGYTEAVDYWSIGVILYILLCGFPPFYDENNTLLFEQIKHARYDFPSPYWDNISEAAKDLVRKLLVVDPARRLNADEILAHPWIKGEETPRDHLPNVTNRMKDFQAKKKFKQAALLALAVSSMSHRRDHDAESPSN